MDWVEYVQCYVNEGKEQGDIGESEGDWIVVQQGGKCCCEYQEGQDFDEGGYQIFFLLRFFGCGGVFCLVSLRLECVVMVMFCRIISMVNSGMVVLSRKIKGRLLFFCECLRICQVEFIQFVEVYRMSMFIGIRVRQMFSRLIQVLLCLLVLEQKMFMCICLFVSRVDVEVSRKSRLCMQMMFFCSLVEVKLKIQC